MRGRENKHAFLHFVFELVLKCSKIVWFFSFTRCEVPSKSDITNMLRMFRPYYYIRVYG